MLDFETKIRKIIKDNNLTIREFCKSIGIADMTLYNNFKKKSIETKYLQKISEVYNVPLSYFLSDKELSSNPELIACKETNNTLSEENERLKRINDTNNIFISRLLDENKEHLKEFRSLRNDVVSLMLALYQAKGVDNFSDAFNGITGKTNDILKKEIMNSKINEKDKASLLKSLK